VTIIVTGITQDEPREGPGTRSTCPDARGVGTGVASVRAERKGTGDGRVYHVSFAATDGRGGTCTGTLEVCVPHDLEGGRLCVDQGPLEDSTGPCVGLEFGAAKLACAAGAAPRGIVRQVDRAERHLMRFSGAGDPNRARKFGERGKRHLEAAARLAARNPDRVSPSCASAVQGLLVRANGLLGP
jgi:hypothetical protein